MLSDRRDSSQLKKEVSKCFTVVTTISTGLQYASWKVIYQHWVTTCFMEGQLSALGYNMLHGRSSNALWQLRESESHFNSRTQKADNWTVWNDSWWRRRSKHSSAPSTEAIWKEWLRMFCNCLAVHLAYGDKPETIILDQTQLRSHLEACLLKQQFTPFPHTIKKTQRTRSQTLSINFTLHICIYNYCFSVLLCTVLIIKEWSLQ